jgi:hypothetical protein
MQIDERNKWMHVHSETRYNHTRCIHLKFSLVVQDLTLRRQTDCIRWKLTFFFVLASVDPIPSYA